MFANKITQIICQELDFFFFFYKLQGMLYLEILMWNVNRQKEKSKLSTKNEPRILI